MNKINISLITFLLILVIFTVLIEDLDLVVSSFFYSNSGFSKHILLKIIHKLVPIFVITLILALVIGIVFSMIKKNYELRRKIIYLLLCLAIGPGLIVNTVFKNNFGRARPSQIIEFGGSKEFSRPFVISGECVRNCSFVSGHASIGFYTTAFAYVKSSIFNPKLYALGIILGIVTGLARIMQGGHFLSDVVLSGLFVIFINHLLYYLLFIKFKKINIYPYIN